jgi:hypothetical protein
MSGIGADRLHLAWVSSAEAQRFVEVVTDVSASIHEQGKLDPDRFSLQLAAAEDTLSGEPLRWMVGKEVQITTKGDVYGRQWDEASYESIMDRTLEKEYHKNLIVQAIKDGCQMPRDISARIGLDLQRVSFLLTDLEKARQVEFKGMEACKPVFAAL